MTYAIDPAMSFCEVISFYEKYIDETKAAGKNLYLSCIFSQADTKSRLIRPSAYESCQVPCHPAYFLHNLCKQTFYGKYIFKQK